MTTKAGELQPESAVMVIEFERKCELGFVRTVHPLIHIDMVGASATSREHEVGTSLTRVFPGYQGILMSWLLDWPPLLRVRRRA